VISPNEMKPFQTVDAMAFPPKTIS